jgi:hypothetical protein
VRIALLNLISTPIPVLNSVGLDLAVGLSSDDPVGGRRESETFAAFLTIYAPDGRRLDCLPLGEIPPHRRRMIDVTPITRERFPTQDHLVVAHRIPTRLLHGRRPDDVVDLAASDAEFAMYRTLVQYSFPGGANGSVIYETPPGFNAARAGRPAPATLSFTSKIVLSSTVDTHVALINYSVDPAYERCVDYRFALFAPSGDEVVVCERRVLPFTVGLIDIRAILPPGTVERWRDPTDGLASFGYVGYSVAGALIPLILTVTPSLGAVAVEHTHPAQAYTIPRRPEDKNALKARALGIWAPRMAAAGVHRVAE